MCFPWCFSEFPARVRGKRAPHGEDDSPWFVGITEDDRLEAYPTGEDYAPWPVGFTGASLVRICVARAALRSEDSMGLPLRFCR